eukprot:101638_1
MHASTKLPVCKYFHSLDGCRFGEYCRYSHSLPSSIPVCKFYSSDSGCVLGDNCNYRHIIISNDITPMSTIPNEAYISTAWEIMMNDLSNAIEQPEYSTKQKPKAICILKYPQEQDIKFTFINFYKKTNQSIRKLRNLLSSNDHIIYIGRTANDSFIDTNMSKLNNKYKYDAVPIRIIPPDLLPKLSGGHFIYDHHIIYPKDTSKETNKIEMLEDAPNSIEKNNVDTDQKQFTNNTSIQFQRSIIIIYIRLPNDPHPSLRTINSKICQIGYTIRYHLKFFRPTFRSQPIDCWTFGRIISSDADVIRVKTTHPIYNWLSAESLDICSNQIEMSDCVALKSISLTGLDGMNDNMYPYKAIYYSADSGHEYIYVILYNMIQIKQDQFGWIFRYDIIHKFWQ